jgi:hypothetical protein
LGKPVNQKTDFRLVELYSSESRMLLFFIGSVLTFNLGRDITLITLYPFLFGYIMLTMWAQFKGER